MDITPTEGYKVILGSVTKGSNRDKVNTWIEYKITPSDTGYYLHVMLFAQATWDSGTASDTKKQYGYVQMNGGTKRYLNTLYDFGDKQKVKFADYTFTVDDNVESVTIYGQWDLSSTYITQGIIPTTTILIESDGSVRIFVNGEWKKAVPYVYTNNEWRKATPYIYTNNEWRKTN